MTEWGIDTLFNPGKRHLDEEKRRLQATREEVGDSSGGRRIDFESGKIVISRGKSGQPADTAADESDLAAEPEPDSESESDPGDGEQVGAEQVDAEHVDAEQADGEQADAEDVDSEHVDSEH